MHLCDGGGGHRLMVKVRKQLIQRCAQFLFYDTDGLIAGKGRDFVLKPHQVKGHIRADNVGPGGHGLTDFDKTGAEGLESIHQLAFGRVLWGGHFQVAQFSQSGQCFWLLAKQG